MRTRTGARVGPPRRAPSRTPFPSEETVSICFSIVSPKKKTVFRSKSKSGKMCRPCKTKKVVKAMRTLKDRKGTNPKKLVKCLAQEFKVKPSAAKKAVKKEMKRGRIATRSTGSKGLSTGLTLVPRSPSKKKTPTKKKATKKMTRKVSKKVNKKVAKPVQKKKTCQKKKMVTRKASVSRPVIVKKKVAAKPAKRTVTKRKVAAKKVAKKVQATRLMKCKFTKVKNTPKQYCMRRRRATSKKSF